MKRLFLILLLAASALPLWGGPKASNASRNPDWHGHYLQRLWRQYERADRDDRPKTCILLLDAIREQARDDARMKMDYYDATVKLWRKSGYANWNSLANYGVEDIKQDLLQTCGAAYLYHFCAQTLGIPTAERMDLLEQYREQLLSTRNTYLWAYSLALSERDITSDFEAFLWDLVRKFDLGKAESRVRTALEECVRGRYPNEPNYVWHYAMPSQADTLAYSRALDSLTARYAGTAFAFVPREKLLLLERDRLGETATEQEYLSLRDRAKAFQKEREPMGQELRAIGFPISYRLRSMIDGLERSRVLIDILQDTLTVVLRNKHRVTVSRSDGWKAEAVAPRNRFYLEDTVQVAIPRARDDGDYTVNPTGLHYGQYTLSLAVRRTDGRHSIFAADHRTGEPLGPFVVELKVGGKKYKNELATPAFTPLSDKFEKALARRGRKNAYIRATLRDASGALRLSPWVALGPDPDLRKDRNKRQKDDGLGVFASIFRDKGAYLPKDSVRFKTVLYTGNPELKLTTCPAGTGSTLSVTGPDGKSLTDITLTANAFGSAASAFRIPEDAKPGLYTMTLKQKDKEISSTVFRVEEYTLNNFKIVLDEDRKAHVKGEPIRISGRVLALSGHPVSGARVQGTLGDATEKKLETTTGADGAFSFVFQTARSGYDQFTCTCTDATGETQSLQQELRVLDDPYVYPAFIVLNTLAGTRVTNDAAMESCELLDGPVADIRISTQDYPGHEIDQQVRYQLSDRLGKLLLEGEILSRDTLHLDLSSYPDGFYLLEALPDGKGTGPVDGTFLAKFDTEARLEGVAENLFLPGKTNLKPGEDICFRLGASAGPVWVAATLSDPEGNVLDSRVLSFNGVPGDALQEFRFPYAESYPDAVRLQFLYFRNGDKKQWNETYTRQRGELDLPLQWTRFEDRTRPAASYTFTARVPEGVEGVAAIADRALDRLQPNEWQTVRLKTPVLRPTSTAASCGSITGVVYQQYTPGERGLISGTVVDESGEPLIGAAVCVASRPHQGVCTDLDGKFRIVARSREILSIDCIGYVSVKIPARTGMRVVLREDMMMLEETVVIGYGVQHKDDISDALSGQVLGITTYSGERSYEPDDSVWEEDAPAASAGADALAPDLDFAFRDSFADVLAFEPFLRDAQGEINFSFRTSDRLSTYRTALFVHNRQMQNGLLQRDFTVTIPVKVAVNEPHRLYAGDDYDLTASAYSTAEQAISGTLWVLGYDGVDDGQKEPLFRKQEVLTVPANASAGARFSIRVPAGIDTLGLKVLFDADGFRDGVAVKIPVSDQLQTRTESHSALLRPGQRADSLANELERRFVNLKSGELTRTEVSLDELIRAAAARERVPDGDDVIALSKAYCAQRLSGHADEALLERIFACRNEDGGFGWTPGMDSSPEVTAALLDHFALLREEGIGSPDLSSSVKYLDQDLVSDRPWWAGGLSYEAYMLVRSRYAEIPFSYEVEREERSAARTRYANFRRFARSYLSPSMRYDMLDGRVLAKAERVQTLRHLTATQAGLDLAVAWGEHFGVDNRLRNAIYQDLASLVEYAVEHPSGGIYYPNAVMPYRAVLETEAYAHALLCELFSDAGKEFPQAPQIAEGIRLWLMIQHETQDWGNDPGFLRALRAAGRASEETRATRLMVLSRTGTKPFTEIKEEGNGYTLSRSLFREDGSPVTTGDVLHVGETIRAVYAVKSKENRSYILLTLPREACFTPTDPLSGPCVIRFTPAVRKGWYARVPDAYRSVKPDRSEVYFDVFPEGEILLQETWYVTQSGVYVAPPAELRCDYAPHYRATARFIGKLHAAPLKTQE